MMTTIQAFKENDATEAQVAALALPMLDMLGIDRDAFYEGAYRCFKLGEVIYDLGRDPTADVITREVFRTAFFAIHGLFTSPGTYEFYIDLFKAIFGQDAEVMFEIPDPGQLTINVQALDINQFKILARAIIDDVYEYYPLTTNDGSDYIIGQGTVGARTQDEINALIAEIAPSGVYTICDLTT